MLADRGYDADWIRWRARMTRDSRLDPPDTGCFRDRRHRSGRNTLVKWGRSGDLDIAQEATWGMSVALSLIKVNAARI